MDGVQVLVDSLKAAELIKERSGLSRKVYMLVDERLPQNMHIQRHNKHSDVPNEVNIVWRSLLPMPQDELAAIIRKQISEFTARPDLSNDVEGFAPMAQHLMLAFH